MTSTEKSNESLPFKKWECGDPYQYQIPANGDHWENLLAPLMESDKAQCDAWKDEVQNLLIFAGLFSGVLTAFVIESYQDLQADPNDIMIALLTRIATRLDNPLNGTSVLQQIEPLPSNSPLPSSIRINVFWFISLVLSLTTVLIGIISLQWLREHQQYPTSLSSKEKFGLFNMRARGLEAWYVPQIFAALPVLQFALVLFFVGLVDFLLSSGIKVAIPVIITIGIPLIFLIWTTVMPSLQAFVLCLPHAGRPSRVPEQCPYKSTQSRIFRHICTISELAFLFCSRSIVTLHYLVILLPLHLLQSSKDNASSSVSQDSDKFELKNLSKDVFRMWCQTKWLNFDQDWLKLRDAYALSLSDGEWWISLISRIHSRQVGPLYDWAKGVSSIIAENVDSTVQSSGYHCVQDLTSSIIGKNSSLSWGHRNHNQYLQKILGGCDYLSEQYPTFSGLLEEPSFDLLRDENSFIFLSQCPRTPSLILLQHFAELHIRILNYPYPKQPLADMADSLGAYPSYPVNQWMYSYGKRDNIRETAFDTRISAQFSIIIDSFIRSAADSDAEDLILLNPHGLGESLRYAAIRQSEDAIPPILDFLTTTLDHCINADGKFGQRSDYIFYISAFYARSLAISDPWHFYYWARESEWDDNPLVEAFLPVLRSYLKERGTPDTALGERLGIPSQSDSKWWGFLNRSQNKDNTSGKEEQRIIDPPIESDLKAGSEENPVAEMNPNAGDLV